MNKRVFSLVCIVLYAVLAVSIHCSQNKVSGAGNKNAHDTKEIDGGSNHHVSHEKDVKNLKFPLHLRDKLENQPSNNNETLSKVLLPWKSTPHDFLAKDPELLKFL
ncbi:hypothetical protein PCHAJ_000503400 [Plasmodium chabaudi chabaudi]|uniref:Fam-c protein n=1 Tax=Plasmodium chabaudi chabaudi TaxID=31271 RepID=A0A1C6WES0_PLACU|nr:hypothetical protein PCHAJ_000503400 [Plasmodium chabaudi chabaudi]